MICQENDQRIRELLKYSSRKKNKFQKLDDEQIYKYIKRN